MSLRPRSRIDIFTITGANTWNKFLGAKWVHVTMIGAGSGGNGGGLAAVAGSVNPALGGNGGAWSFMAFPAALLGNTEVATVGAGGGGGAASIVAGSLGAAGGNGGNCTFGSWFIAFGAQGSLTAGTTAGLGIFQISLSAVTPSTNGGQSNAAISSANLNSFFGGAAGGCGGTIAAGILGAASSPGGTVGNNSVQTTGKMGYAGLLAGGLANGGNGNTLNAANSPFGGSGGGGGNALAIAGAATIGGLGGFPGGGGGAGGAGLNLTSTAANGGNGGNGIIIVEQFF
jgi:hypothetical protein